MPQGKSSSHLSTEGIATGGRCCSLTCTESKVLLTLYTRRQILIIILFKPVRLQNFHSFFINFIVVVGLQILNLLQTLRFIDVPCVQVQATTVAQVLFLLSYLQDVLQAFQRNCHDSRIWASQEVAKGLDATLSHKIPARTIKK